MNKYIAVPEEELAKLNRHVEVANLTANLLCKLEIDDSPLTGWDEFNELQSVLLELGYEIK